MSNFVFLGISRINGTPEINVHDAVVINGACRIIDSDGNPVEVEFLEASANGVTDLHVSVDGTATDLAWSDDDEFVVAPGLRLTEADNQAFEQALADAIFAIDLRAQHAAEEAWDKVWVEAAVAAERV